MNISKQHNISCNKVMNDYFNNYYFSKIKETLYDIRCLPTDISKYILKFNDNHCFSEIEINKENVNSIKKIPEHVISIFINGLDYIPEVVLESKTVILLNVSFNGMVFEEHDFFKQLVYLNCSFCNITKLPNNLDNLLLLESKYNNITELPYMKNIKHIDIFNCKKINKNYVQNYKQHYNLNCNITL